MQKPITQNQSKQWHERLGAIGLGAVMVIGTAAIAKTSRGFEREVVTNPAFGFIQNSERENETGRIPVRFDDIITTRSHGGL